MSNSTLKDVFKPSTKKNSGGKNAAWYNSEKKKLLAELAVNEESVVRMAIATNTHTPAGLLAEMLKSEQDTEVLRAVMFNGNLSRKAAAEFVGDTNDPRVEEFNGDHELIAHFNQAQ